MRRIFRSMFRPGRRKLSDDLPNLLVKAAIDRVVDRTDKRLRALSGHQKVLRKPVVAAIRHVIRLVDQLPSAIELSPRSYGREPTLRAAFASAEHLRDTLGRLQSVRHYLGNVPGTPPAEIYGLVTMFQHRRHVLGLELHGDMVVRDVMQTAVSFSDYRFIAPAGRETRTRRELKIHAFDFLLEAAVQRIRAEKARRAGLLMEREQLRRKIESLKSEQPGQQGASRRRAQHGETAGLLRSELQRIDAGLGRYPGSQLGLEESLDLVVSTLNNVTDLLAVTPVRDSIDYRGIKLTGRKAASAPPLRALEFASSTGFRRTVFLARIPRADLPPPVDAVKRGESFLGGNCGPIPRSLSGN